MNNFKISVVIPTFNREKFIQQCVDSLIETRDKNIEIIIIDNASTDKTISKLEKYKLDKRIKIYRNNINYERSYSRNLGFRKSSGKFVTLLDSDDLLDKNIFSEFRKFYAINNEYNIYFSNFKIYNSNTDYTRENKSLKEICDIKSLSNGNYLSNICVFFRKKITDKIKFDENPNIIGIEDYDFNLRAVYNYGNAIKFSSKSLGIVKDHKSRSVNMDNISNAEKRYVFFKNKIYTNIGYMYFSIQIKRNIISTASLYVSLICIKNKNKLKSFKYLCISVFNNITIIVDKRFYYIIYKLLF